MSNVAEEFDRNSSKEFINFLLIARGSCAGIKSLLYAALNLRYIEENIFRIFYGQISKVGGLINEFISFFLKTIQNPSDSFELAPLVNDFFQHNKELETASRSTSIKSISPNVERGTWNVEPLKRQCA